MGNLQDKFVKMSKDYMKKALVPVTRDPLHCSKLPLDLADLARDLKKNHNPRIVVAIMDDLSDFDYGHIKKAFDGHKIVTQCCKLNTSRKGDSVVANLMLKINMKLGGTNCILAHREGDGKHAVRSDNWKTVPNSISWMFDEPCMLVGIDVNHPEDTQSAGRFGSDEQDFIAAITASMDGWLSQYAAYVTTCKSRAEPVEVIKEGMISLLKRFYLKNDAYPKIIIVYRDGVADNQFDDVRQNIVNNILYLFFPDICHSN